MQARVKPLRVAKARKLLGALIVAGGTLLLLQQFVAPGSAAPDDGQAGPADPAISRTHRDAPAPAPVKLLSA
ncbi:hypothetical protein [Niveibacterium terrae]|uniref:hypothetical protein n=1 Tax=Niveibacterium terrae TaxID=3373598 RepID=UPI003A95BDBC